MSHTRTITSSSSPRARACPGADRIGIKDQGSTTSNPPLDAPAHVRTLDEIGVEGEKAHLRELLVARGVNNVDRLIDGLTDLQGAVCTVQYWDDQRGRKGKGLLVHLLQTGEASSYLRQQEPGIPRDPHREPSGDLLAVWMPIEDELRRAVGNSTFNMWLAPLHPHAVIGGVWRLAAVEERMLGWVEARYTRLIADCAGRPVEFVVCDRNEQSRINDQKESMTWTT